MKILFCNTGWMSFYDGITDEDEIFGGASFIKEHGTGGEIYNFSKSLGKYYGFVMSQGQIRIEKLGVLIDDNYIDNVLVVWLATHPKEGKVRIVGWYRNARVYRERQEPIWGTTRSEEGYSYNIEASVEECTLIPSEERSFVIPKATKDTGGIGQSSVWYCDGAKNKSIREEVLNYIKNYEEFSKQKEFSFINRINTATKLQVENNAINMVQKYFEREGFTVISVERDNIGWDLEAKLGLVEFKIEVKGLSGENVLVNLTPNEYENMKKYKESYKLCVVTKALDPQLIKLHIFSYEDRLDIWQDDNGNILNVEEKVSAKMYI